MKVICIDGEMKKHSSNVYGDAPLVEGGIYTVVAEMEGSDANGIWHVGYVLEEIKKRYCFDKNRFVPISEINETEMIRENNLEKTFQ